MPRLGQKLVDRQDQAGFVTVAEAARRSGFCERTIRDWVRKGTVRVRRVGPALVFVDKASLAAATGTGGDASSAEREAVPAGDLAGPRGAPGSRTDPGAGRMRRVPTQIKKASPMPGFRAFGMWIGMGVSRLHWALDHGLFQWCWRERMRDERSARRATVRL